MGVTQSEGAVLEFTVEHVGSCSGTVEVNEFISYHDAEGNVVSFPSPELDVDCDIVILPEACPEPIDLTVDGCEDTLEFDAGDLGMESLGRIIQLSVTLAECLSQQAGWLWPPFCPRWTANVGEHKRGMKTVLTRPTQGAPARI